MLHSLSRITDLIASNAPASELTPVIEAYGKALDEHLRWEEDHLQVGSVGRGVRGLVVGVCVERGKGAMCRCHNA